MEKIRIMILEDVPFDAELAEKELERGNIPFTSLRVETEAEFRRGIQEFEPHLILADHSLPSFDGKSALKIAQQEIPQVPFIFLSGKIGGEFVVEVLREGAKDYVFKNNISKLPYTIKRALDEVEEALELEKAANSLKNREAQLSLITGNIQDLVMQVDDRDQIQYLSSSLNKILGFDYQDFLDQTLNQFLQLLHPEDVDNLIPALEEVRSSSTSVRVEFRCKTATGDYHWLESLVNPFLDENQEEKGLLLVIRDIDSRKKVEFQLARHRENLEIRVEERTRELGEINLKLSQEIEVRKKLYKSLLNNEKRLESIINGSPIPTFVIDTDHEVVYWNRALENFTGINQKDVLGTTKHWHVFYPEQRPCMADLLLEGNWKGIFKWYSTQHMPDLVDNVYSATGFFPNIKDGRWLCMTAFPLLDSEGVVIGAVETLEDITQEVQYKEKIENSLEEKEILLREIHHRVRNNLQIISSLISLQSHRLDDEETIHLFRKTRNRIQSMALVHEKLYQSGDFTRINLAEYIQDLVLNILSSYEGSQERITLEMDCEPIWININTAIPCALIINELVTNSVKHAFPHEETGKIIILLHKKEDRIIITCTDTGVGLPDDINLLDSSTLGLKLVQSLTEQLKGKIKILRTEGTSFEICINSAALDT